MVDLSDMPLDPRYRTKRCKLVHSEVHKKLSCSEGQYHLGMIESERAHARVLHSVSSWYKLTDRIRASMLRELPKFISRIR
jgi:hypothetical protein